MKSISFYKNIAELNNGQDVKTPNVVYARYADNVLYIPRMGFDVIVYRDKNIIKLHMVDFNNDFNNDFGIYGYVGFSDEFSEEFNK